MTSVGSNDINSLNSSSIAGEIEILSENNLKNAFPIYTCNDKDKPQWAKLKCFRPFAIGIAASRNSGKSYLLKHLYTTLFKNKFDIVILFSKTISSNQYDYLLTDLKNDEYDDSIIKDTINQLDEWKNKKGYYPNTLIIFDDILDNETKNSNTLDNIVLMGRHKNISIIFLTQQCNLLSTKIRNNLTHLFILNMKKTNRNVVVDNWLEALVDDDDIGNYKNSKTFCHAILKQVFMVPYRALFIQFEVKSQRFIDQVKTYTQ